MKRLLRYVLLLLMGAAGLAETARGDDVESFDVLAKLYARETRPIMARYCLGCHSTAKKEGELDLERFGTLTDARRSPKAWQKVAEMLDNGEMPPKDAKQPPAETRKQLRAWVAGFLDAEARASAGDPGPVVLRRLSNSEYNDTVRDLTGVDLQPARDFPVDGAAGEGFTNTGNALVMSPALLTKYLDAGKEIAKHAVLLPDGIRFSSGSTRRDWTDERLAAIRALYSRYADPQGYLPLEKYLAATLAGRSEIGKGKLTPENFAKRHGLNPRYFALLWNLLTTSEHSSVPDPLFDPLRAAWRKAKAGDAASLAAEVAAWQKALSRLQSVGHMKARVVPVDPLTTSQELRLKIPANEKAHEVTLYLVAGDAGDGNAADFVVWQQPRLVTPGRPDLALRDVRAFSHEMTARRQRVFSSAAKCLEAAAEASTASASPDVGGLARRHGVDRDALAAWLDYLGIGAGAPARVDHFTSRMNNSGKYDFIKGWGTGETPLLVANSSGQYVRIPGNMKPHSVAVHPSPTLYAAVGWQSPIAGVIRVQGKVTHAHPECGNGVTWSLELRRGSTRQRLATGTAAGAKSVKVGPIDQLAVQTGDLVSLLIGPRDGNHACDLTDVDFVLTSAGKKGRQWNLARDVSSDVLAGNPHADRFGNAGVWHFYTEPVNGSEQGSVIPAGSLLACWQSAERADDRQKLADAVQKLLTGGPPADQKHPDALLFRQLASLGGPLFAGARSVTPATTAAAQKSAASASPGPEWGLDPTLFGRHPNGSAVDAASLCVQAPSLVEIRLPADLVAGSEFVVTGALHRETGGEGSVQLRVLRNKPESLGPLRPDTPVLVGGSGAVRKRIEQSFADFRRIFPAALCYTKIVPVDEVVTLTLFHREDESLCRLMLDASEHAQVDRLWNELHFVSQDALTQVDAFEQLWQYATQDSDPRLIEPYRKPINERAAAFRKELVETEPRHIESLTAFAPLAYRRPLSTAETQELRELYRKLRKDGLPHEAAIRLTLARIFVAPAFLYRLEEAAPGAAPGPVTNWELANRLSYFLWSSMPDAELREAAASGRLRDSGELVAQARRMLRDGRTRRLAVEFACQWLRIRDFDTLNEKSERHFPTFAAVRGDIYEESIRFFTDLFQRDGSVLEILDADHTFVNESLAKHYGIPGVTGPEWRRIDGIRKYSRGGVLGLSAVLAKESGASRSSPTLRGNWVAEVLLGDRLPRPPKDVPRLPEDESAAAGLTVRQLVEKHSVDSRCAACHVRIDPFGFALEEFDSIGRRRSRDVNEHPINTKTKVQDGSQFEGIDGLRQYLLTKQRDAVLRQFCRKLLGYALGRGVQLSDAPLLTKMQQELEKNNGRFSAAVETIIGSRQFREIRGKETAADEGL